MAARRTLAGFELHRHRLELLGLGCALLSLPALADPATAPALSGEASAAALVRQSYNHYRIPAQPLASALNSFALQSGLQISVDSRLLEGHQAQPIQGDYTPVQVLGRLLQDTSLVWQAIGEQSVLITSAQGQNNALLLDETQIQEQSFKTPPFQGMTTYGRDVIERMTAGNGDYTSLLRLHPSVQFEDTQLSSKTPGEIDPADISINGAKFWQNLFLIDGMEINNDINPGDRGRDNYASQTDLPGNKSQGLALDADLLKQLTVYDSNVPAQYGGFNGGVIDAETRDPRKGLHGSLSASMSRDSWTRYHIKESDQQAFYDPTTANGDARNQTEFRKLTYRANLEGHITDDFGLLFNMSRKESRIPNQLAYNTSTHADINDERYKDVERTLDNFYLKAVWRASDRLNLTGNLSYAPQDNDYFIRNGRDSMFSIRSGGYQAGLTANWQGDWATWTHKLSWSDLQQSRRGSSDYYAAWYYSEDDKNWGNPYSTRVAASAEGSWGDVNQEQERLGYTLQGNWNPLNLWGSEHRFSTGLSLSQREALYERPSLFLNGLNLQAVQSCVDGSGNQDTLFCSSAPVKYTPSGWAAGSGQAFSRLFAYMPGKIDVRERAWSLNASDTITWKRLMVRPGLRLDGDDYMNQETLAPRLATELDVFGDQKTRLIAGINRYYGRSMFDHRLRAGRESLQYSAQRTLPNLQWSELTLRSQNMTKFTELDIPYDDELTFGLEQQAWNTLFSLKYTYREGRDQIVRQSVRGADSDPALNQTRHYEYTNAGRSESKNLSLSITPLRQLDLLGSTTSGQVTLNWSDITSSHNDYTEDLDLVNDNRIIRYEGDFIRFYERPANNYNRPWTARLTTTTEIPRWNLQVSNFLRWRGGYQMIANTGEKTEYQGDMVEIWEQTRYGTAITWDTRVNWEVETGADQAAFVNLDITNLLDRVNVSGNTYGSTTVTEYEVGRQFTVEVGYRF